MWEELFCEKWTVITVWVFEKCTGCSINPTVASTMTDRSALVAGAYGLFVDVRVSGLSSSY